MKRLLALFAWALVPLLVSESLAQAGDGYVGIYTDAAGTTPCTTVPPLSGTTLYVIANLEGASTAGISGVEFRIEVENPAGWLISYTAPAANIVIGNALDLNPQDPDDGSGVSIAFGACREPVAGNVPLGTLSVFNITGSATRLFVKRHSAPSNSGYQCPLFTLCNDPVFSMSCMTPTTEPPCSLSVAKPMPLNTPADPIVFTSTLNAASEQQIDPGMADQQVLALFAPGIIQLPLV